MKITVVNPGAMPGQKSTMEMELGDVKTLSQEALSEALFYADFAQDEDKQKRLLVLRRDQLRRWLIAEEDEEIFCDEVHTTYLHELGHYLGLDEDELTERGLE